MLDFILTDTEVRVLGCFIEKEITTPDYYPLSVNAITNACNQTSNRHPIVSYDEQTVTAALTQLKEKEFVSPIHIGRVAKYEETFIKKFNLVLRETAVLCVLMLRGPQTIGEIRSRVERFCTVESLEEVKKTVQTLEQWGYIALLPRQRGQKESRYTHLLCGPPENREEERTDRPESALSPPSSLMTHEAVVSLQAEVAALRQEVEDLKQTFASFKAQFE